MERAGDPGNRVCLREVLREEGRLCQPGALSRSGELPRDGYDFDARYDDGLAKYQDKQLYDLIDANGPILSKELRRTGGYAYSGRWQKTEGKKGFDTSITRLQEQCYVLISDFVYTIDKKGNRRGWGVAEYNIPEKHFGDGFTENVYVHDPKESYERLLEHLVHLFPRVPVSDLKKFLK